MTVVSVHPLPAGVDVVDRREYVVQACRGKRVLHLGCTDSGLTDERLAQGTHLHARIAKVAKRVWGVDIDETGLQRLAESGFKDLILLDVHAIDRLVLDESPDIIVAPELLEHLEAPVVFLRKLRQTFPHCPVIVSVPNAFNWQVIETLTATNAELVHEDHNCYFSPTTIKALLQKAGYRTVSVGAYSWTYADARMERLRQTWLSRSRFFAEGLVVEARPSGGGYGGSNEPCRDRVATGPVSETRPLPVASRGTLRTSSRKPTITFFAGDMDNFQFAAGIMRRLEERYDVRAVRTASQRINVIEQALGESDLGWFEWGNGPIIAASHTAASCPLVCRVHRYEIFQAPIRQISWSRVARGVFVSETMRQAFYQLHPEAASALRASLVIPNAVDLGQFPFSAHGRGFDIVHVGRIHPDKNLPLLLQCMAELVKRDKRYRCHVVGQVQDVALYRYLRALTQRLHLEDNVIFHGHQEIPAFLVDKSFIVLTSIVEGHPLALLEGMAMGLRPLVHDYYGLEAAHVPPGSVFRTPQEFASLVIDGSFEPELYRAFVEQRYAADQQYAAVEALVEELLQTRGEPARHDHGTAGATTETASISRLDGATDWATLRDLLQKQHESNPSDAQVINDLAVATWHVGDREKAVSLVLKALSIDPANADARANLKDMVTQS